MDGTPSPEDLAAFKKLFWEARKAHRKAGKKASAEDLYHQEALSFAWEHHWGWAETILEALRLAYADLNEESLSLILSIKVPLHFDGERFFVEGLAQQGLKDFDAAIQCYRKALGSPGYANPGNAWYNMGNVYSDKEDFDAAIECYHKALDPPSYDTPGDAWNNMGNAYSDKEDFDAAMECYRKALDSPGYDAPGDAWHNMGAASAGKNDFEGAIEHYRKALDIPGYDTPHLSRLNLSINLRQTGRLAEAEKEIQQVLSEPDTEDQHSRANVLLSLLKDRRQGVELDPEDEALTTPPPPSSPSSQNGPEDQMRQLLLDQKSQYVKYLEREVEGHFDDLTILRGWSSSVTLLEGSADCQWVGGGYFLKWRGCGVVIDPGLDFLDNFHEAGFHATEIHAVIVSHNHPDHNYDLGSLDNLFHEIHRASKTELKKPFFILDEDTAYHFPKDERAHRGSPASFSRSDCQLKRWQGPEMGLPITIEHFFVSHGDDVKNAVGLRLRLHQEDGGKDIVIGYTADGKITADLVAQLENCDVVIAHVSQPDARELDPKTPNFRKEYHLGYKGAIDLIQKLEAKPKIALIGEFWAGLADLRIPLISGIRLRTGMKAAFPACIGLSLRLPDLTIRCTQCKNQVPFSQIKITPPLKEFGLLGYLCNDCIL